MPNVIYCPCGRPYDGGVEQDWDNQGRLCPDCRAKRARYLRQPVLASIESHVQPLCRTIEALLNSGRQEGDPRRVGFAVLLFRFDGPEATYGSNAERGDMIRALRECADRLEARADAPPIDPSRQ